MRYFPDTLRRLKSLLFCLFLPAFASAQIINIEELRIRGTNDSVQWYGHVNFAANLTKVTQTVSQLRADVQLEWKRKRNIILSLTNYNFVKAANKNFVNSGFQHLRYNYKIKPFLTWECFGQVQENQIQLIDLRMIAGTGLRYRSLPEDSLFSVSKNQTTVEVMNYESLFLSREPIIRLVT